MPRDPGGPHIMLIAGEPSGDILGAGLMRALRAAGGAMPVFSGVGGAAMAQEGLESLFPIGDIAVMGIAEVVPRLPRILSRISQTAAAIRARRPDVVITIDSPDFCFRVVKAVRGRMKTPPVFVHYVAPTVWAWRAERAAKAASLFDGMMCLLPFEPPYFEKEGMAAVFTGHPMLERRLEAGDGAALRRRLSIPAEAKVAGVLFGSRMGELNRTGPALHDAAALLSQASGAGMHLLCPTLPHLEREVRNLLRETGATGHVVTDRAQQADCFAAMDFALATSGTVGLELAMAGVPHVIAYRMNPLTFRGVRKRVTVRYAHLVNIMLDRAIVPEFIQEQCNGEAIAAASSSLDREGQLAAFAQVRAMLAGGDGKSPSQRAAGFVLERLQLKAAARTV